MTGRYRLVESIGQGGMGRVWRAADEMLDREVAVKEMRIDGLDAEDARTRRERTLREARATARIDHPNVVRIYDVVDEGERLWIVMELVAGRSLERMMVEDGPLGPLEAARIGVGLVTALRQVHARGVLHRDIKPGNVLVERNGHRVVLTDFGIAAIQDAKALTMVGMLVGSPDYMAPERISGRPQGPPSDIWSLGATLCAAMGGHSPFSRDTTLATLHAVLYEEPELPSAAGPLRDILAALLEKDPDVRPGLAELEIALHPVAFPTPTPTVTVRGAEELREEKRPPEPGEALPDTDPGSRPEADPSRPRAADPKPHPHPETPEHLAGPGPEGVGRSFVPDPEGWPAGPERVAGPGAESLAGSEHVAGAGPGDLAEPGAERLAGAGAEGVGRSFAPDPEGWPAGPERVAGPGAESLAGPGHVAEPGAGRLAGAGSESMGRPVAPESEAARGSAFEGEAAGGSGAGAASESESPTPSAPTPRTPPPDHAPPDRATPQLPWAPHESPTPAYLDASRVPTAWDPRRPEPEPEAVHDAIPQQRTAPAQTQQPATHEPAAHPARTERPVSLDRPTPPPALNPGNASTEAAASTSSEVRSETPVGSPAGAARGVSLNRSEALTERRPVHEPPLGTEPGELPGPARPTGPRRPHRRTGLLAAAAVVTAGAVVAVVLLMNSGSPGGNQAGGSPTPSPTVSGTPSPTVEGTSRPQSLPPGAHREAGGFAWATPEGWRRDVKTGAEVHYTSPDGRQELVAKSSLARGDLMETWETSEANAHQGEDYQKIRLEETKFRDYPAVVWEYTFTLKGTKWHARLLGFNADGKSYQINTWYQPDIENQAVKTYDKVTDSFTIL
ncbi:serine/threonine-protein kinase [Streptomyces sp. NBC_00140]|uniref:serine/threonine-protein kinase n=1 Tax=Streptomyces sp. NBC_00140 TaxID=2975664 RepID=UPI002255E032|nr:serine/threonine protein kinase [Streptomyces sp. NBC_00140]MCX5334088.1 protein kinase [Streptomyces sp. NBC_00140]